MIPIKYPDSFPDIRKFSGKMHDPTQPLKNPNAKADWSVGDIAWVYMEKKQMLVCGPVTFVHTDGLDRFPFVCVRDITGENDSPQEVSGRSSELFESEEALMRALLFPDATESEETPT